MKMRWITYASIVMAGNQSSDMGFHPNLNSVKAAYLEFCEAMSGYECIMTVYFAGDDQSMYDLAKEYETIGVPFDYPDKLVERGPRGGIKVTNT